ESGNKNRSSHRGEERPRGTTLLQPNGLISVAGVRLRRRAQVMVSIQKRLLTAWGFTVRLRSERCGDEPGGLPVTAQLPWRFSSATRLHRRRCCIVSSINNRSRTVEGVV